MLDLNSGTTFPRLVVKRLKKKASLAVRPGSEKIGKGERGESRTEREKDREAKR